jgi:predicted nucleotidyltransferase
MSWRFQQALDEALTDLSARPGAIGILFFGSALTGTDGPTSDLDLYVLLDDTGTQRIEMSRYAGCEAEVHLAPVSFWRSKMDQGRVIAISAFATGQALLDRTGVLAQLQTEASEKLQAGPPALTQGEIDRWRYRLTDLAGDLEDVAGQPADERLLGALLVSQALEAYCALHRLWGDKPKRLINYVERHDPELGRMARTFFAGDLDRHLARTLIDRVLAPFGGPMGAWESP